MYIYKGKSLSIGISGFSEVRHFYLQKTVAMEVPPEGMNHVRKGERIVKAIRLKLGAKLNRSNWYIPLLLLMFSSNINCIHQ